MQEQEPRSETRLKLFTRRVEAVAACPLEVDSFLNLDSKASFNLPSYISQHPSPVQPG